MADEIILKDLLEAGCHFGHQSRRWHPKMKPYIFGVREGVHIFDLAKTREKLVEAVEFVRKVASEGGVIVFVGTKRQAAAVIKEESAKAGMPWVAGRWLGGTLTNWEQIKRMIDRLQELKKKKAEGEFEKKYTKKENLLIDREVIRLEKAVGGLVSMTEIPEALLVVDIRTETVAVAEANKVKIPVVAVIDSNSNPDLVEYPIPGNDDAVGSVKFIVGKLAEAIKDGREMWQKKQQSEAEKKDKEKKE